MIRAFTVATTIAAAIMVLNNPLDGGIGSAYDAGRWVGSLVAVVLIAALLVAVVGSPLWIVWWVRDRRRSRSSAVQAQRG